MPILVSQRFSGSRLAKVSGNWTAFESCNVVGTPDKNEAIEAAFQFNTPHGDNPNMRCGVRNAENHKGPLSWIVTGQFSFGDHGACALSPLDEPPKLDWDFGEESIPSDSDVDGNPKVNSAGQPFDPPLPTNIPVVGLMVRRAEPFFSVQKSIQYMDKVNSDDFTIQGAGGVSAGQAYCHYIKPAEPYTNSAPFVWVEYRFEFKPGTDPFQDHPIDMGRSGWYSDSGTPRLGPIVYGDGTLVPSDVLLDGTGKPLNTSYKIHGKDNADHDPIANPNTPAGLVVDPTYSTSVQKTLVWKNKIAVAFSGIL